MNQSDEHTDRLRVGDALRGDEQAITELWMKLSQPIRMMARKYLGAGRNLENSEDIQNEAFLSFLNALRRMQQGERDLDEEEKNSWNYSMTRLRNELIPLALGIAKRIALEANRSELAEKRGGKFAVVPFDCDQKGTHNDPLMSILIEEQFELLRDHVAGNQQLELILARLADDISGKEIAAELGISQSSVSRRIHELRRVIEEYRAI